MARVQFGPAVSDASGRVAGSVFSHWRGVQYLKRFAKPGNPQTAAQTNVRDAFKSLTVIWKLLESVLVAAWELQSKGKAFSGRNYFLGQGVVPRAADEPFYITPHNPDMFPVTILTITPGADQLTVNWQYPSSDANQRVRIYRRYQNTDQMVFVSEESHPTATKIVSGLTGPGVVEVYLVNKDNVSGALAQSAGGEGTPT